MKNLVLSVVVTCLSATAFAQHGTGYVHRDKDAEHYDYVNFAPVQVPAKYDLRPVMTPVKDQGAFGNCWAFSTTGALEGTLAVKEARKVNLSEQQLVSCNTEGMGPNGGSFIHEMQVSPGQAYTSDFPYVGRRTACKQNLPVREKIAKFAYIGAPRTAPTTEQIKQAIFQNGPVSVTVTSESGMQRYRGGLFTSCGGYGETNHMVVLVGWDDVTPMNGKTGYWIMRNSWSSDWGDKGYMYMPYGCSRIGEEAASVFLVPGKQVDAPPAF